VRIVGCVTRGMCGLGYHVVWCPKFRRPVRTGRSAARCEGLSHAKADEHGWQVVALEVMPDRVHLFVKAHRSGSPSRVASQFTGLTSRRLPSALPHLRPRRSALPSWSYCAAVAGAVPPGRVRRSTGTRDGRLQ
jgi:putative transposase